MIWDADADAALIRLWDEGGSLSYVADEMRRAGYDVNRNAIAGRRHRLRQDLFKRRDAPPNKVVAPPPKRPRARVRPMTEPKPSRPAVDFSNHAGVEYLKLPRNGCKAIMDHLPRAGRFQLQRVCGLPRLEASSYCNGHYMAYTNPQLRKANG